MIVYARKCGCIVTLKHYVNNLCVYVYIYIHTYTLKCEIKTNKMTNCCKYIVLFCHAVV